MEAPVVDDIRELVGVDFPLFAFSHCRDVVAAVSRAGGFGVLGAVHHTPEELELELRWIDDAVGGKPYGVDILMPDNQQAEDGVTAEKLFEQIPSEHRDFLITVMRSHDVAPPDFAHPQLPPTLPEVSEAYLDVAFRHPIRLIANALGTAPASMLKRGRAHGVPVAALVGAREHALKQVAAGVDILVAQGGEAGGHCGEVATMVLVPEVIKAVESVRPVPVLAAGGIMTGRQMAAAMAMGAAGAWTGSVWLATPESEVSEVFRAKMIQASSRDTTRSKYRTGKFSRQLRSEWHDLWETPGTPEALPMPLMSMLCTPVMEAINSAADSGNLKARELASYWVGQGVGLVDKVRSCREIVQEFMEGCAEATEDLRRQFSD
jgi:NAD(P)H-dependent flavin oxidoreductase YrpB (nitropropane dioxygenase family)